MSLVLSASEFDVLWESFELPRRHVAIDVPSGGTTRTERAELVTSAWASLSERRLARNRRPSGELADLLHLLARPQFGVDVWVWAEREIRGRAVSHRSQAVLAVVDNAEVWLIPATEDALPEAAVSVAGDLAPGIGQTVSIPYATLRAADAAAKGDPKALVTALEDRGVALFQAQELSGMLLGQEARGQFGAERVGRDGVVHRADRVVAFFDTDSGRYLFQVETDREGREWATVTPADNALLATRIRELMAEA
ncbi:ESX secretion-associated protein EspG [Amycolatopsis solani]|uniref:ESX secretion-associated protein EspG n=1 Tax=Amycolatopsis solani TaxID=3028615 RepID=UPI0025AEF47D|nr:ESX secretion-associated protein EspG [Amycolatopsis sp. MEP2-6]